ncbi:hypothetical protein JR065_05285 [Xanthomonas sp. AmX2]|uniref:hypothetical protein n=1 Tax=Xanthomonas sp. TaxID=29446 RepID=UPI0019800DB8|nr:hypothetical protein [Xanthomonas sp.]MBN6149744.1 hypothetical protein [Xanthomonas sp.]
MPLNVDIHKQFRYDATLDRTFGIYRADGGVRVQMYEGRSETVQAEGTLSYEEYAELRKKVPNADLPEMRPPEKEAPPGNTIGRVVGQSGAAPVKAAKANPPVRAETAAEKGFWESWGSTLLDGTQTALDVAGLVPGLGEFADLGNAGISAARGDYVGAGLSLASAIPFAGWGAAGAKAARRVAQGTEATAKAAKEATERAARKAEKEAAEEGAEKARKPASDGMKSKGRGKGPCDHLKKGNPDGKGSYRGGSYGGTKRAGIESHHAPANSVSPLRKSQGPAIQMDPGDHEMTSSHGHKGKRGEVYREGIAALLDQGKWRDALVRELRDIRSLSRKLGDPAKYNEAMLEMLEYFKCLEKHGLLPGGMP